MTVKRDWGACEECRIARTDRFGMVLGPLGRPLRTESVVPGKTRRRGRARALRAILSIAVASADRRWIGQRAEKRPRLGREAIDRSDALVEPVTSQRPERSRFRTTPGAIES